LHRAETGAPLQTQLGGSEARQTQVSVLMTLQESRYIPESVAVGE